MKSLQLAIIVLLIAFQSAAQEGSWKQLNDSLIYYYNAKDYQNGIVVGEKAVVAARKEFKENHQDHVLSLTYLAQLYNIVGQYNKAEPLYLRIYDISKKLGESHPYYITSLAYLASFYQNRFQFEKAEPYYIEAVNFRKKTQGETNPEYLNTLGNLADLYRMMGQYEKAEPLFIEVLETGKKMMGEEHPDYAKSLGNLGSLYRQRGEYGKAEAYLIQAMEFRKKNLGEMHADYASSVSSLAVLYNDMGQYDKAESLLIQAAAIYKKTLGESHLYYVATLGNLAAMYAKMRQYDKAEPLYLQTIKIYKSTQGEMSPGYAGDLGNLAMMYFKMDQNDKAEPLFLQAMEINKKVLGETHMNYAASLRSLGVLYSDKGQYEKAESFFKQANEIFKKSLGERHPMYATTVANLAELYKDMGQYQQAEPLFIEYNRIIIQNMTNDFNLLSEKEKGSYLTNNISVVSKNNGFLYYYKSPSAQMLENNYNLQLVFKSLILADTRNMLKAVKKNPDTAVSRVLKEWQNSKKLLAMQYSLPVAKRRDDISQLETSSDSLEKELGRRSAEFRKQQESIHITTEEVRQALQRNEAAIEFVRFGLSDSKKINSVQYAAYILKKDDPAPVFVPLCDEKQLQQLFDSAGKTATSMVSHFYRGLDLKDQRSASLGKELYKLIWAPLAPYLKGVKKIFYSPAGKLYSIAFHALAVDSLTLLMDQYQLQQYTSTRQTALRLSENEATKPENISLFGNASFTMDSTRLTKQKNNQSATVATIYTPPTRGNNNAVWSDLPGTAEEITKIKQLFDQYKITTTSFVQTAASEENLKAISGHSPQILHIATHGFFLPEPDKTTKEKEFNQSNSYSMADDPLLRSGLILAGGNYAWSGKTPIDGIEDGIATAYEISQLDLSNTELVVLSACETALGDVKGSEGVFGLQRAFKMAGVKKMIVSLWQVPDKETAELMTTFYSYWIKGKTINDAFAQAQADMREKYAPYFWAGFVLVE